MLKLKLHKGYHCVFFCWNTMQENLSYFLAVIWANYWLHLHAKKQRKQTGTLVFFQHWKRLFSQFLQGIFNARVYCGDFKWFKIINGLIEKLLCVDQGIWNSVGVVWKVAPVSSSMCIMWGNHIFSMLFLTYSLFLLNAL